DHPGKSRIGRVRAAAMNQSNIYCTDLTRVPGWVPYIWLAYLTFFLWDPIAGPTSWQRWAATGTGVAAFLFLYFSFFRSHRPWSLVYIAGVVAIGMIFAPFNHGAACFFIYASSFIPFAVCTELAAAIGIAMIVGIAGLEGWLLHIPSGFVFP